MQGSSEPLPPSNADLDPLEGGRGLVVGTLISAVLLCGIAALAVLLWVR